MVAAKTFLLGMIILFSLLLTPAFAAEIRVFVDQDPILANQSFQLYFEATGSVDEDPDFTPLQQDFEIRGRNLSSSTSIVNGDFSSKKTWILTLLAKQAGNLTVPAILFGSDRSTPLPLTVVAADSQAQATQTNEIFLEVTVEPKTAYVQQRLTYSVRLFRRIEITNASLSEPEFKNIDCSSEKLGKDREFETIRSGRRYLVVERQYALFPQQSGELVIEPARFEGQLLQNQRSFFGTINQPGPIKRLQSEPLRLQIKPIPATFQGKQWLPAEKLQLSEAWSTEPSQLVVGEPTTRTLTLTAVGIMASQLPEIFNLPADSLPGCKVYPDQALLENDQNQQPSVAIRQEKIALIPTRTDNVQLPEISIDWWNTLTDRPETAFLPAVTLQVSAPATTPLIARAATTDAQSKPAATALPSRSQKEPAPAPFWPILVALLAGGWLLTILAWWRSRRKPDKQPARGALPVSATEAERRLKTACQNNAPLLAKDALLDWGKQTWPQQPPTNLNAIGARCGAELGAALDTLNRALYAQDSRDWDGNILWQAFNQNETCKEAKQNKKISPLKELNP